MKRRRFLALSGSGVTLGLAGCTYNLDDTAFHIESDPVGVPDFLLDQTIVGEYSNREIVNSRDMEYRGEEREIHYTQWLTELVTEDNNLSQAWFFTQPNRDLGGLTINPTLIDEPHDMVDIVNPDWEDFLISSTTDIYTVDMLGNDVEVREYDGNIYDGSNGQQDATYIYTKTESSNDEVAFFAGVPDTEEEYRNDMVSMIQASIHPKEENI